MEFGPKGDAIMPKLLLIILIGEIIGPIEFHRRFGERTFIPHMDDDFPM